MAALHHKCGSQPGFDHGLFKLPPGGRKEGRGTLFTSTMQHTPLPSMFVPLHMPCSRLAHPSPHPLQCACAQVAHAWSGLRRSGVGQALLDSLGYGGGEAQEVGDALLGMAASYHGCVSDDEEL